MKRSVFPLLLALAVFPAVAQKVKYKDLFVLLNARQFDQAEPYLRKYLKENDDNPNAFLFMGQLLQEKSLRADVLKETETCRYLADSANLYYDKALKGITEKELKRNDEYYQAYSRRDLRTGEFGIKISDIHLDIEKRMQAMKERSTRVAQLKSQFLQVESIYGKAVNAFKKVQASYPGMKELLLRADESTVRDLDRVGHLYDSTILFFNAYKTTLGQIGKTGYNQSIQAIEISDFKASADAPVDFYADQVKLLDFKKWATGTTTTISNEVAPLRKELIAMDIAINKLGEKIKKDSVSVKSELAALEEKVQVNPVAKFDPMPMPLEVFKMKLAELKYASLRVENKSLRDTADLTLRMKALQAEVETVQAVDETATRLMQRNIEEEAINYQHFVANAYGTTLVLSSLIRATRDYAIGERTKREAEWKALKNAMDWLVVEKDSIPLTRERSTGSRFKPLLIEPEKYTLGLRFLADSLAQGYFYTITPSRKPDVKVNFPVDTARFTLRDLPVVKGMVGTDAKSQLFYAVTYSETRVQEKFPFTIAKIYRTDGLAWTFNYLIDHLPSELIVNDTGDLSIKVTSPAGESRVVVIDKNGKMLP